MGMPIWTIGHSTLPVDDFVALVAAPGIELLADVRRFPSSRRHPQFNGEALAAALKPAGIAYRHFVELGGRRKPRADSSNTGWRETGFRGYADYMETVEFANALAQLLKAAASQRTVIMCAEKSWHSCHRRLISDLLKASGHTVIHIIDGDHEEQHAYTKPAIIVDGVLSYAAETPSQASLDL